MQSQSLKKTASRIFLSMCLLGYAAGSSAHNAGATLGNSRSFIGMAFITCNAPADQIIARIKDKSPPVPNLLVNMQIVKGNKSNSITDTVSGDANFSPFITLQSGDGVYWIMVNKTDVGARQFELEYHCETRNGVHTETEIGVSQFGDPNE